MENNLHNEPAGPEEIWRILRRISEQQERTAIEMEKRGRDADRRQKEADRRQAEAARCRDELERQMKDTDRCLQKTDELFNSQWGKLMESLVEGDLVPLLREQKIAVDSTCTNVKCGPDGRDCEFDILAVNGEEVVVVEVKTTLRSEDVTEFMEKLGNFHYWMHHYERKKILGAVAFLRADTSVRKYAERKGLYVIRATGSSASIINRADFQPRVFA